MATIRAATIADVETIYQFIRALAKYERLEDQVSATVEKLEKTLFDADAKARVLIAEQDGVPVGFALYFFNYSTFLAQPGIYLEDLYVLPAYRGCGIGNALLQALAKIACDNECGRLEWSVLKWNQPAIAFYEKLGAQPLEDWVTYRLTGEALSALAQKSR